MNPLSQNQYIYGLNNPLKYTDPSGNLAIMDTEGNVLYNHYTGNLIYTKGTEKDYTKKLEYIPDLEPSNPIRINYYKEQRKKKTLAKIDKYMKKFCDGASKIGANDTEYIAGIVNFRSEYGPDLAIGIKKGFTGIKDDAKSILDGAIHPDKALNELINGTEDLYELAKDPQGTTKAIQDSISKSYDEFNNSDNHEKVQIVTQFSTEIVGSIIAAKGVDKVVKVIK